MTEQLVTLICGLRAEALELEAQAFHRFPSDREGQPGRMGRHTACGKRPSASRPCCLQGPRSRRTRCSSRLLRSGEPLCQSRCGDRRAHACREAEKRPRHSAGPPSGDRGCRAVCPAPRAPAQGCDTRGRRPAEQEAQRTTGPDRRSDDPPFSNPARPLQGRGPGGAGAGRRHLARRAGYGTAQGESCSGEMGGDLTDWKLSLILALVWRSIVSSSPRNAGF